MLQKKQFGALAILACALLFVGPGNAPRVQAQGSCDGALWEEINGFVVIEMESVPALSGEWEFRTNASGRFADYTGVGYLFFNGPSVGNRVRLDGDGGLLEYPVKINTPGVYRFEWYNLVGKGTNNTESNDSWIKVAGIPAANFYAIDQDNPDAPIVYAKGSGLTPRIGTQDALADVDDNGIVNEIDVNAVTANIGQVVAP